MGKHSSSDSDDSYSSSPKKHHHRSSHRYSHDSRSRSPSKHYDRLISKSRTPSKLHRSISRARSPSKHSHRSRSRSPSRYRRRSPHRASSSHRRHESLTPSPSNKPAPVDRVPVDPKDLLPAALPPTERSSIRIHLTPEEKLLFETLAKGTLFTKNSEYLDKVARVDSVANRAPYLQREFRKGEGHLKLREQSLIDHHDMLFRTLGVTSLIGKEGHDQEQVRNCIGSLVSMMLHSVTVWRRWMALDNLSIPRQAIPGSSSMLLDLKEHDNPNKDGDKIHYLFGPVAEKDLEKAIKERKKEEKERREHREHRDYDKSRSVPLTYGYPLEVKPDPAPTKLNKPLRSSSSRIEFAPILAPVQAGRLAAFVENWLRISSDSFILQAVQGYSIPFKHERPRHRKDFAKHCDPHSDEAKAEVHSMLEKKAIFEISPHKAKWISPMFFVPKKDGSMRPVINLKELNKRLYIPHFKMEGLLNIKDLVTPGCYMAKIDLKDAYFGIPIAKEDSKFLVFRALGKLFAFRALPFGLATAPYAYTRVTKIVATHLRSLGLKLVVYLDDWLFIAQYKADLVAQLELAVAVLTFLGFVINNEKSQLIPSQRIEFLGFELNSLNMTIAAPTSKIAKVKRLAQAVRDCDRMPARQVAQLCGLLASLKLASELSRLRSRAIQRLLKGIHRGSKGFNKLVPITREAKEEASFWTAAPLSAFTNRIVEPPITRVIRTDASLLGWGMQMESLHTGGRWSQEESRLHINVLELKAMQLGLQTAFKNEKDIGIRIESDNTTAIAFINRRGGTRSHKLHSIAVEIWQWALCNNIYLTATHIAGVLNIEADQQSRNFKECCEWEIDSHIIEDIFSHFGSPAVDLFASRLNKKCKKYYSLNPDPEALGIDAFSHNWKGCLSYAFPPFNLVGRTIRKAQSDSADLILITPQWESAPFWPMLINLSDNPPIVLDGGSIKNPHTGDFHPLHSSGRLKLNAWKICCRYG